MIAFASREMYTDYPPTGPRAGSEYPGWDWSKITAVSPFTPYNDTLFCTAHEHGVKMLGWMLGEHRRSLANGFAVVPACETRQRPSRVAAHAVGTGLPPTLSYVLTPTHTMPTTLCVRRHARPADELQRVRPLHQPDAVLRVDGAARPVNVQQDGGARVGEPVGSVPRRQRLCVPCPDRRLAGCHVTCLPLPLPSRCLLPASCRAHPCPCRLLPTSVHG